MVTRFSMYGFLTNQRYFEPFLLLAFLDAGLSFTAIGALIAIREVCVTLFEVPSGAAADVFGRCPQCGEAMTLRTVVVRPPATTKVLAGLRPRGPP